MTRLTKAAVHAVHTRSRFSNRQITVASPILDGGSHTKDQLTNMKARQCGVSSSLRTFHATACSYDTGRPMLDTQTPLGRYAKP
jgi:hypothetical protein